MLEEICTTLTERGLTKNRAAFCREYLSAAHNYLNVCDRPSAEVMLRLWRRLNRAGQHDLAAQVHAKLYDDHE